MAGAGLVFWSLDQSEAFRMYASRRSLSATDKALNPGKDQISFVGWPSGAEQFVSYRCPGPDQPIGYLGSQPAGHSGGNVAGQDRRACACRYPGDPKRTSCRLPRRVPRVRSPTALSNAAPARLQRLWLQRFRSATRVRLRCSPCALRRWWPALCCHSRIASKPV